VGEAEAVTPPARGPSPTRAPAAPAGSPAGAAVCPACALVCTDLTRGADGALGGGCEAGREADRLGRAAEASAPAAAIDGVATDAGAALATAAARLRDARRVLVAGLGALVVEDVAAACDLAESLGAAIAGASADDTLPGGPSIARHGSIGADWEELRDRADLVLFFFHDPHPAFPRFVERFLAPEPVEAGRARCTLSVGPRPPRFLPSAGHRHLDAGPDDVVALAGLLTARLLGRTSGPAEQRVATAAAAILSAIDGASCVAIVTGAPDPCGAGRHAVAELVRTLVQHLPAFEIPLRATAPDEAGAAAVLAWRYGTAGDIPRADAAPAERRAIPFSAAAALATGAFDALVALGPLPADLEAAVARRGGDLEVVRLDTATAPRPTRGVFLRRAGIAATPGTLVRADGRTLLLGGEAAGPTARDLLLRLGAAPGGLRPAAAAREPDR
jgi:formylmethanofuran dehydrogenase subunit B